MKISTFLSCLNKKAPFRLAEKWDNVGLIAGDASREIKNVVATLDLTDKTIDFALKNNANLIIAHHPLIFTPISSVTASNSTGLLLMRLIEEKINLIVAHTNFDKSPYNSSYQIARLYELSNISTLQVTNTDYLYKIAVFVPKKSCAKLKKALSEAGAGVLGNYSQCAYMIDGTGEFMGNENSNPAVGAPMKLERVEETRLEMIFPEHMQSDVVQTMRANHPYEEPAYDVYQLKNAFRHYGYGVCGDLKKPLDAKNFIKKTSELFATNLAGGQLCAIGQAPDKIKKIAVVNGSGFDAYKAAISNKCDAFITGDVSYHRALELASSGLYTIDCTHFATEVNFAECLKTLILEIQNDEKAVFGFFDAKTVLKNPMEKIN